MLNLRFRLFAICEAIAGLVRDKSRRNLKNALGSGSPQMIPSGNPVPGSRVFHSCVMSLYLFDRRHVARRRSNAVNMDCETNYLGLSSGLSAIPVRTPDRTAEEDG
jgi:hypothetical protein